MKNIKQLKEEIKPQLNRETVATLLSFMGYPITKDFKFAENKSYSINKNGNIKDFGSSDFYGDIFALLIRDKNMSFPESVKYIADCLGVNYE